MISNREGGGRIVDVHRRMGVVLPVCQQEQVGRLVGLELAEHPSGQRLSIGTEGVGSLQPDEIRVEGHIGLPSTPNDREPVSHQEPISRVRRSTGVSVSWTAVEAERSLAPAIHNVEENSTIALVRVCWLKHREVRREPHLTIGISGCKFQVVYSLVSGVFRVHGKVGCAFQEIVGPHVAEGLSIGEWGSTGYIKLCYRQNWSPHALFSCGSWLFLR